MLHILNENSERLVVRKRNKLPGLNLDHLVRLTDDTGILQHSIFTVPNRAEGYSIDDNARALILAVRLEREVNELPATSRLALAYRYLAFLEHALNRENGRFRNFLSYDRRWLEDEGSEDSHGRTIWALGTVLGQSKNSGLRGAAERLFSLALPAAAEFHSPRASAYVLLGLQEYLLARPRDTNARKLQTQIALRLADMFRASTDPDWSWFEDVASYANARLPQALMLAGKSCGNERILSAGVEALDWLMEAQIPAETGLFAPIGSNGFYQRSGTKARFDQQPIEAAGAVSACLEAYRATGDERWRNDAWSAFLWFLGDNDLHLPLYDADTGGCRDGLHPDRPNQNQGAESTLSFLTALLEMHYLDNLWI